MNISASKFLHLAIVFVITLSFVSVNSLNTYAAENSRTIHVLFLHGMPETPGVLMPLKERLEELFEKQNIVFDFCYPHLPDTASVADWSENVAEEINQWNPSGKIVVIGISMGGKVAIHLTAQEQFGVQNQIDSVITINSPIRSLNHFFNSFFGYYYPSFILPFMGTAVMNYSKPDGFIDVIQFDSSSEAKWIASEKNLLTFISGEQNPNDELFDGELGDMFPRAMDDGVVPMNAQYIHDGSIVYYGIKPHEAVLKDLSSQGACDKIASTVFDFLMGKVIMASYECNNGIILSSKGLFSEETSQYIVANQSINQGKRDHLEIRIGPNSSIFHHAKIQTQWKQNLVNDTTTKISISKQRPLTKLSVLWTVFEKRPVYRLSYFSD